jgi:SAM-dependent methyltransferase
VSAGTGTEGRDTKAMQGVCGECPTCGTGVNADLLRAPDRFHWRPELYRLVRCQKCSYVRLVDPPAFEDLHLHYDEHYHRAIMAAGEGPGRWARQHKVISSIKRGGALLDIGCSSGGFLAALAGAPWTLFGIEIEASAAERARRRTGAQVFVGDVVKAPFACATFDVITCFDVLEHVYNPRQFLDKIHGWLKPGGIFYTMLPNIDSWEFRVFRSYWYGLELPRHISHFSPMSLRHLMASFGFEEVFVETRPTNYIERSVDYLICALLQRLGVSPIPQAQRGHASVPARALRKALRLCLFNPLGYAASVAGRGASMEAVFRR